MYSLKLSKDQRFGKFEGMLSPDLIELFLSEIFSEFLTFEGMTF